jgi:hypothetical protein
LKNAAWMWVLAGAVVGCSGSPATGEDVGAANEPIVGGSLATQYPEAAYLDIDITATGEYLCSATLIAPKVVLTAGHCVDTHTKWEVHVGAATQVSTSAMTYDWNEHGATTVNPAHHDLGLVFLSQAISIAAYPTLASAPLANGAKVTNVGRIKDGVITNALYAADTTVSAGAAVGYPFDYQSSDVIQPGDSGGPDFASGTHVIAAVNSGAGGGTEVLARVDLLETWIAQQIAAHGGGGPAGDAGAPPSSGAAGPVSPQDAGDASKDAPSSVDAGASRADAMSPAPTADGGASKDSASASPACAPEMEPNGAWSQAEPLPSGATCGTLTVGDQDWFAVTSTGGPVAIDLVGGGDALLSIGQVSGSTCSAALIGLRAAQLTATAADHLCVVVASPTRTAQSYELDVVGAQGR